MKSLAIQVSKTATHLALTMPENGQRTEQVKTGQVNPDRPLVGPSVDTFVGGFMGRPWRAENRESALVGALVGPLVGGLVGPSRERRRRRAEKWSSKRVFWRVRFLSVPLRFSSVLNANLKGAEKKRTLRKHLFERPFLRTTPSPLLWRALKNPP